MSERDYTLADFGARTTTNAILSREMCDFNARLLSQDPVYIEGVRAALIDSGLAELVGLAPLKRTDPYGPIPHNWTAIQVAFFNNGVPEPTRKRPKIQRTKMEFGGNLKVWVGDDINFSLAKGITWQANIYLWTADEARQIARDLHEEKYVDAESVALVDDATSNADADLRFSIPMMKAGVSSKWMRQHLVMTKLEDGVPDRVIIVAPDFGSLLTQKPLATTKPNGKRFGGNAISQARIARHSRFSPWATEIVD